MNYPIDCSTPARRTEWLYRAQELLRLLHNIFSKWLHEGLTQVQYNKLPQKIKNKYSYKFQLSKSEWDKFYREDFRPRSERICTQINVQRAQLKCSNIWDIKVEDI